MIPGGIPAVLASATTAPAVSGDQAAKDSPDFSRTLEEQINTAAPAAEGNNGDAATSGKGNADADSIKDAEDKIRAALEQGCGKDGTPLTADQIAHLQQLLAQLANGQLPEKDDRLLSQLGIDVAKRDDKALQGVMSAVYNQLPAATSTTTTGNALMAQASTEAAAMDSAVRSAGHIPVVPSAALNASRHKNGAHNSPALATASVASAENQKEKPQMSGTTMQDKLQTSLQQAAGKDTAQNTDRDTATTPSVDTPEFRVATDGISSQAPVATTLPASLASAPVLNQQLGTPAWQQALSQQVSLFTRNGIHNAELRLHPEELGALQVNLRLNNDQVQVHFVSENHQVRAALEAAMPHLRTSLAESGINLGNGSVGSESSSQWNQQAGAETAQNRDESGDAVTPLLVPEETLARLERSVSRAGGVDIFA